MVFPWVKQVKSATATLLKAKDVKKGKESKVVVLDKKAFLLSKLKEKLGPVEPKGRKSPSHKPAPPSEPAPAPAPETTPVVETVETVTVPTA